MAARNGRKPSLTKGETITTEDEIRRRAFELYEQRGREDGRDVEDWLRAEEEITQSQSRGAAA
jgi:hypothetical protein